MNFEEGVAFLNVEWKNQTLADLCQRARAEKTGIAFDALRVAAGPRLVVIMCITSAPLIGHFLKLFPVDNDSWTTDWSTVRKVDVFVRAFWRRDVLAMGLYDASARVSALALIAADPCSITKLTELIPLPV